MKKTTVLTSILFLAALSVDVFAIGNIGTPTAELKARHWSIGGDYTYSDMNLDMSCMTGIHSIDGPWDTPFEFEGVKTNFYYATVGYGVTDKCEVFGRLGAADTKTRSRWPEDSSEWTGRNFDNDWVWGFGLRYTFYEQEKIHWGVTAQMSWIDTTSVVHRSVDEVTQKLDLSAYDLLVAVGPTVDMGGWKLYGGPFYYMLNGDADMRETWPDGWWTGSSDVEEDSNFGGYIGTAVTLPANIDVTFEVVAISGGWAAGVGVNLSL